MIRRLREFVPQPGFLATIAVVYFLLDLPLIYAQWRMGRPIPMETPRPSYGFLQIAALAWGASRVLTAHPFYRFSYRDWLETTPWTSLLPLPLGAPRLIWQDGVALGLVVLLSQVQPHVDPLRIACLTLLAATALLTVPLWFTGLPGLGYGIALLVGLAVRLYPERWAYLGVSIASYAMAWLGLTLCLARFPWPLTWLKEMQQATDGGLVRLEHFRGASCGWPYDLLRPPPPKPFRLSIHDAALVSLLAGWWVFAVESLFENPNDAREMSVPVLCMAIPVCVIVRFFVYRVGYAPPLSLWGRLWTGRWIIPGYDQVYVGPACALVTAIFAFRLMSLGGWPVEVACPSCLALVLFVTLTAPPGITRWRLTGRHRLVPSFSFQQDNSSYVHVG